MPGGVAGERSAKLTAPMPIFNNDELRADCVELQAVHRAVILGQALWSVHVLPEAKYRGAE